ncbi:MAG: hypothetical protein FJX36_00730 [Alphaproteobacteria bacterium]|nr:hypothetical protein [Alphaproteobacteria bacterium]
MYTFPLALLVLDHAPADFWTGIGTSAEAFGAVTVQGAFANLIPVTIGNVIGGADLVGLVYWFVYLRPRASA